MTTYARIVGGGVAELFTPPTGVPISSCFNSALTWVECDGVPGVAPGWTYSGGVFSAPPAPPAPTALQVAAAAYSVWIAAGLTIASTGTPAINGVYAIDAASCTDLSAEAQFISAFSEFTNGATTGLLWPLLNGSTITFPTTALFMSVAKAAAQQVAAAKLAAIQGAIMPTNSVTVS